MKRDPEDAGPVAPKPGITTPDAGPESESLLKFPTTFPIKIMGRRSDGYAQAILDIVLQHAPDFVPSTLEMRASRGGNYLSVTVTINATSREQLDNLYRALTAHPMVTMVL